MIYKFKSKASGDIIMMAPTGDALLRAIGREPAAKGIIEPAAMAAAVLAIEAAVQADETARAEQGQAAVAEGARPAHAVAVSLRQRLWPMRDMLQRAAAAGGPVVWGV